MWDPRSTTRRLGLLLSGDLFVFFMAQIVKVVRLAWELHLLDIIKLPPVELDTLSHCADCPHNE